jgi:hypothetical protein
MPERRDPPAAALGFAEMAIHRWIEQDDPASLDRLFIEPPDGVTAPRWPVRVDDATAVASKPVADDYWSVTLAVQLLLGPPPGHSVRWFVEVGVTRDDGGRFVVAGTPAIVAEPAAVRGRRRLTDTVMLTPSADDPLARTVTGFLAALLTGDGQIDRYTASGTEIAAIDPPPFAKVVMGRLSTRVTEQGTAVRASVLARTADGDERALAYQLLLTERYGRWEVRSMSGAPALATSSASSPAAMPSSTTSTTGATASSPGA